MDGSADKRPEDEIAERIERLAREAGKAAEWTVGQVGIASRQVFNAVSREAEAGVRDLVRRTSIIMDEAKNELPRLRAELREVQERVRERLR
jgi:hypothetical protein